MGSGLNLSRSEAAGNISQWADLQDPQTAPCWAKEGGMEGDSQVSTEVQLPELGAVGAGRSGGRGHRGFSKGHVECGMTGMHPEVPARISRRQLDTNTQ